jgi:hypothetical protein
MQATTSTSQQIAETILAQLGGKRFVLMTGSKHFLAIGNGLRMDLSKNATCIPKLANCETPFATNESPPEAKWAYPGPSWSDCGASSLGRLSQFGD